jgi:anti-sigma factor RsiW
MSTHMNWETLNDYADQRLTPPVTDAVTRHLDECDECRRTLARLRNVLAAAQSATTSVEPPAEAWQAIRAEIDLRKVVPLPGTARPVRRIPWLRVAAVAAIIVVSSATTVAIMNVKKEQSIAVVTPRDTALPGVVPVSVTSIDKDYEETVRTLTATLEASRSKLAPETIEAVERNLKIIDDAITEARDALLRDPASTHLRGMLSKNYQQKVDLLRRVSARVTS